MEKILTATQDDANAINDLVECVSDMLDDGTFAAGLSASWEAYLRGLLSRAQEADKRIRTSTATRKV